MPRRPIRASRLNREVERKEAAFAHLAAHANIASVQNREAAGERQSKASTLLLAAGARFDLLEFLEYSVDVLLGDPDAGVGDHHLQSIHSLRGANGHGPTGGSELDGIGDKVEDHLLQLDLIRENLTRIICLGLDANLL